MANSTYMADIGNRLDKIGGYPELQHSTSRKQDPSELDMTDFLNLMVVQLQNQTIDSSMDTSDMLNQMVQMQMVTALANMTDASVMSYASSLVGKEVTIGDYSAGDGTVVEKVVTITGSGLSNGKQVLFAGDEVYELSSVMAVGRLPAKVEDPDEEGDKPVDGTDKPTDGTDKPVEGGGKPVEGTGETTEGGDKPVEGTDEPTEGGGKPVEGTGETTEGGGKPVEGTGETTEGTDEPAEGGDKPVEGTDEPVEDYSVNVPHGVKSVTETEQA